MAVSCGNRLEKADCGHFAVGERIKEVVEIILMVGAAVARRPDILQGVRPDMRRVGGRCVVLEERVVRNVILGGRSVVRGARRARPVATRGPVRVVMLRSKPPMNAPQVTLFLFSRS